MRIADLKHLMKWQGLSVHSMAAEGLVPESIRMLMIRPVHILRREQPEEQ